MSNNTARRFLPLSPVWQSPLSDGDKTTTKTSSRAERIHKNPFSSYSSDSSSHNSTKEFFLHLCFYAGGSMFAVASSRLDFVAKGTLCQTLSHNKHLASRWLSTGKITIDKFNKNKNLLE
jgi:hypothetical protein